MDEFSAASADVANVITQVKTVSDQVSVLRSAVDETSLSLNISATQTSQKILSYALNFYDARKDSSERQTNRLPQNIKSFFEDKEFMKLYLSELKRIANLQYLEKVLQINKSELEKKKKLLQRYHPNINVYSEQKMIKQIEFIKKTIKSLKKNNIYFS